MSKYFKAQATRRSSGHILYSAASMELISLAKSHGAEMVEYDQSNKELDEAVAVYCPGYSEEEKFLRQWAIRQRRLVFSEKETFLAYLKSLGNISVTVKPMQEWLSSNKKGVALQ